MFNSDLLRREAIQGYLFILPWFIGFLVFTARPLDRRARFQLHRFGTASPPWNGSALRITIQLTRDSRFWQSLKVTLVFTIFYLTLNVIIGFALGLVMNQPVRRHAALPNHLLFAGRALRCGGGGFVVIPFPPRIRRLKLDAGLDQHQAHRLDRLRECWALPSIIIMELWRVGSTIIIFLAGLQSIPPELYEAAEVDGANRRWRLWSITIPLMSPSIFFVLIVSFINTMQVFTQAYIMTRGGPNYATYFYSINLYHTTFRELRLGYASAQAGVLFVIIFIVTLCILWVSRYRVNYELV